MRLRTMWAVAGVLVLLLSGICEAEGTSSGGATDAALASVPVLVPEASEQAMSFYRTGNWLWLLGQALAIGVPAFLLASGVSTWLARRCEGRARRWYLAVPLFTAAYLVLEGLIKLPYSYYVGYVRAHAYGLSKQSIGRWFELELKELGVSLLLSAAAATGVYLAIRLSPRRWWLWCGLATLPLLLFMAVIQPVVLDPIFNRYEPLRDQVLEARIREFAGRAGMGESRIFQVDKSRDTKAMNAFVNGWLGTRQIVIWDTMLDRLEEDEVLAIVGHEMGHYKLDHVLRGLVVASGLMLGGLLVLHLICQYVLRREGKRLGVQGLSDVGSLPLLLAVGNAVMLFVVPIGYAHSRYMEREADRFGLELTRLNRAAATSFVKLQESNLSNPKPGPLYNFWRATHPSMSERISFCNEYQPWSEGKPLVYSHLMARGGQKENWRATDLQAGGAGARAITELPGMQGAVVGGASAPLDGLGAAQ